MKMIGARALIECLKKEQVQVVFGYPGGSVLTLYNELDQSDITHVLTGHEQGAVHAADGYARATGHTGVAFATSGPGVCNMVTGIATAAMDSIPLVVISGQVATTLIGRDSFQEADISGITTPITKHNYLVKNVKELPRVIKEAFYIASTGRPGPVLVDIAKDVFDAELDFSYPDSVRLRGYKGSIKGDEKDIDEAVEALSGKGGRRLMEVVEAIGAQMLIVGGKAQDERQGRAMIRDLVASGKGLAKFREFVKAQGGSTSWIGKRPLTKAPQVFTAVCTDEGYITRIDGRALGEIAMAMGAGRARKEDAIDPMVGIRLFKELYDPVRPGEALFTLYGKEGADMMALARQVADHIIVTAEQAPVQEPVISEIIV